jgi:hypothetical protein
MKNSSKLFVAALALASSAWIATAQTSDDPSQDQQPPPPGQGGPQGGPGGGHHRPPPAFIGVLDANHDGVIDADELANASAALKKLDKNGDGQLTMDELMAPPPRPGGTNGGPDHVRGQRPDGPPPGGKGDGKNRPPLPPIIAALDANGDGVIDASELANASAALKKLDKNGDGQLTMDEIRPPGGRGPGGPGGHGPGGHGPGGPPPDDQGGDQAPSNQ